MAYKVVMEIAFEVESQRATEGARTSKLGKEAYADIVTDSNIVLPRSTVRSLLIGH